MNSSEDESRNDYSITNCWRKARFNRRHHAATTDKALSDSAQHFEAILEVGAQLNNYMPMNHFRAAHKLKLSAMIYSDT